MLCSGVEKSPALLALHQAIGSSLTAAIASASNLKTVLTHPTSIAHQCARTAWHCEPATQKTGVFKSLPFLSGRLQYIQASVLRKSRSTRKKRCLICTSGCGHIEELG